MKSVMKNLKFLLIGSMKFLQIKQDGLLLETPRILEIDAEFDMIFDGALYAIGYADLFAQLSNSKVCDISDCYKSKPLIEIDGYTEFDVIEFDPKEWGSTSNNDNIHLCYFSYEEADWLWGGGSTHNADGDWRTNIGSIFIPENKLKYPKLYQKALEIISK